MSGILGYKALNKLFKPFKTLLNDLGKSVMEFFYKIVDTAKFLISSPISVIVVVAIVLAVIVLYIASLVIINGYVKNMDNTCIAEISTTNLDTKSRVLSKPNEYIMDNGYRYEHTTQKAVYEGSFDAKLDKKSDYIELAITGLWSPWFGDEKIVDIDLEDSDDNDYIKIDTPDDKFICNMQKVEMDRSNWFNDTKTKAENEYYFLRNYYESAEYSTNIKSIEYKVLDSNIQQQCKINRGMGLYMGFFGTDGKQEPDHFHHVLATKAICEKSNMFDGKIDDFKINYGNGSTYDFDAFQKDYFRTTKSYNESNEGYEEVFKYDESNQRYVYDIEKHEALLKSSNVDDKDIGLIVANATNAFWHACYKTINNERDYRAKFIFNASFKSDSDTEEIAGYSGQHRLLKSYENDAGTKGEEYKDGEVIKFFILDRYYSDNQGDYKIEFLNGVRTTGEIGTIEEFLQKIEIFMLGSRIEDSSKDRTDGILYKMYIGIVSNSGLATLGKVILSLFVVVNGFMILLGYKRFDKKDFVIFCIKISLLFAFLSETSWAFFNKTFINFIVNGTIGAINMINDIFKMIFNNFGLTNIFIENSYYDKTKFNYLSSNFRFLDTIFEFLFLKDVHIKILSIMADYPIIGFLPILIIYSLLFKYVLMLLGTVIPYINSLIQITILLGLTPIFLLFMFFKTLNEYFKNWLNYLLSRMFELIVFFFVLFFASELVNNKFLVVLGFNTCKVNIKDKIIESIPSGSAGDRILKPLVEAILGDFKILQSQEVGGYFNLLFDLLLLACYIYLYQQFVQFLTKILTKLYSFDGHGFDSSTNQEGFFSNSLDQQINKATGLNKALGGIGKFMNKTAGFNVFSKYTGLGSLNFFNGDKFSLRTTLQTGWNIAKAPVKGIYNMDNVGAFGFKKEFRSLKEHHEHYGYHAFLKQREEERKLNKKRLYGKEFDDEEIKEQKKLLKDVLKKDEYKLAKSETNEINVFKNAVRLGNFDDDSQEYKSIQKQQSLMIRNSIINNYNSNTNEKSRKQLIELARENNILNEREIQQLQNGELKVNTIKEDDIVEQIFESMHVHAGHDKTKKKDNIGQLVRLAKLIDDGLLEPELVGMEGIDLSKLYDGSISDEDYIRIINNMKTKDLFTPILKKRKISKINEKYKKNIKTINKAHLDTDTIKRILNIEKNVKNVNFKLKEKKYIEAMNFDMKQVTNVGHLSNYVKEYKLDKNIAEFYKEENVNIYADVVEATLYDNGVEKQVQVLGYSETSQFCISEGKLIEIPYSGNNSDKLHISGDFKQICPCGYDMVELQNELTSDEKTKIKQFDIQMKAAKMCTLMAEYQKSLKEKELNETNDLKKKEKLKHEILKAEQEIESSNKEYQKCLKHKKAIVDYKKKL